MWFSGFSGIFLAMFYTPIMLNSFESIDLMKREINWGWIIRLLHVMGLSSFFLFLSAFLCIFVATTQMVVTFLLSWIVWMSIILSSLIFPLI